MTSVRASDQIGRKIKEVRQRRGLTAEQLADRCADIGAPHISAAVLANIETGRRDKTTGQRRRELTVEELLILAVALEAPPAVLLLPAGDERLAITPDIEMHGFDVLAWLGGEGYPPSAVRRDRGTVLRWFEVAGPLRHLRAFRDAAAASITRPSAEVVAKFDEVVTEMRKSGVTPPSLPLDVRTKAGLVDSAPEAE